MMTKREAWMTSNAHGVTWDNLKQYRLLHDIGHFMGDRHPKGTVVWGYPYANDRDYLEIITPDKFALTVAEGMDVELVSD